MPVSILRVSLDKTHSYEGYYNKGHDSKTRILLTKLRSLSACDSSLVMWCSFCSDVISTPLCPLSILSLISLVTRFLTNNFLFLMSRFLFLVSHSRYCYFDYIHMTQRKADTVILAQRDRAREGLMSDRTYVYEAHNWFTQLYVRLIHSGANKHTLGQPKLNLWMNSGPKILRSCWLHYSFTQRTQLIHTARKWLIHTVYTTDSSSAYVFMTDFMYCTRIIMTHSTNVTDSNSANVTDSHSAHAWFI